MYAIDVGIITTNKHLYKISVFQMDLCNLSIHTQIYGVKEGIGHITTRVSSDQT